MLSSDDDHISPPPTHRPSQHMQCGSSTVVSGRSLAARVVDMLSSDDDHNSPPQPRRRSQSMQRGSSAVVSGRSLAARAADMLLDDDAMSVSNEHAHSLDILTTGPYTAESFNFVPDSWLDPSSS